MALIDSYENCSKGQGNTKERFCFRITGASHALVHDVPDAELFSLSSID